MEWYLFKEKKPKRNEPILICISSTIVNQAKDNSDPVLNPTYQCVFTGKYDSVIFLQNLILISEKCFPFKKTIERRDYTIWEDFVRWARLK